MGSIPTHFEKDLLGFNNSIEKLALLIKQIESPFTIGIYVEWGSGKSSFMKMLKAHIDSSSGHETFWFNAWEYENETSLLLPLLSKMAKDVEGKFDEAFKSVKKVTAGVVLTGADALLKKVTLGLISFDDIENNLERYEEEVEKRYEKWVGEIDTLKRDFKDLIGKITKGKDGAIIIIDDLDRCMPENGVRLIENIKHFLSVKGCKCIFIIGVDKTVLEKGIQARYGTVESPVMANAISCVV